MDWFVRDIIIYGDGNERRAIALEEGVNIVVGRSQTGKSALIPIVDYCLGAGDCEIPVGVIREFARWYAIRIQTPEGQLFLARKDPGARRNTDEMHLIIGQEIAIPTAESLSGNSDRKAVIEELSRRLGLMQRSLAESVTDTRVTEPPTVRNVVSFLFQPQNVVANKDILFYKTEPGDRRREHRHRLTRVFPFILGAINAEYFQLKGDLDDAQRALRQVEKRLSEREAIIEGGVSTARSLWDRSVALGLAGAIEPIQTHDDQHSVAQETSIAALRERLTQLLAVAGTAPIRQPLVAADPERAIVLDRQSQGLRAEIAELRRQLASADDLAEGAGMYAVGLRQQQGRLRAVDLLGDSNGIQTCPACAQPIPDAVPTVDRIRAVGRQVRAELESIEAAEPSLQAYRDGIQRRIAERRAALNLVDLELAQLYRVRNDAISADAAWAQQQQVIGAIRLYLESGITASDDLTELRGQVERLRRKVERLQREIEDYDRQDRLDSALAFVNQAMYELSTKLSLERAGAALRLDIKHLTIVRDSPTGRPERLYEIGSGENWVGYHLCVLFALHTFFIRRSSPVPSFLFIDQPSQIYFPAERSRAEATGDNTDWQAVSNLYRMIFETVQQLDRRLQVVVLDHADLPEVPGFTDAVRRRLTDEDRLI